MGIGNMVEGTPLSGLGSGGGKALGVLGNMMILLIVAGIIILIVWLILRRRRFDTISPIFSERSGSLRYMTDMGCYSKDKKTNLWDFKFKDLKETAMPPPDKAMLTGSKGSNVAIWYQGSGGEIYPAQIEIIRPTEFEEIETEVTGPDGKTTIVKQKVAKLQVKVIEPDVALWATQMDEKLLNTYGHQTFWDKYGNQIMFFGAAVLTLAMIYLVLKKIDVVQEAARLFGEAAQTLKASSVTTTTGAP